VGQGPHIHHPVYHMP